MKRGGPLKRTKGLGRGKGLERRSELARGDSELKRTPLKRVGGNKRPPDDKSLKEVFEASIKGVRCVVCGKKHSSPAHHITPKQRIRVWAEKFDLSYEQTQRVLWDPRNALSLCPKCHSNHETAYMRVPRETLPARAFAFMREFDFLGVLDEFYPAGRR